MKAQGLGNNRGWLVFLGQPHPLPRPPPRTPPGFAPYAPFLGRSPGTGAFVPPVPPPLKVGFLG